MCARYTLTAEQANLIIAGMVRVLWFAPRYNIAPTQRVPVLIEDAQGVRQVDMRWGFKATWGNTLHINAQAERIQTTATFKALLHQRCLVPMDGFYEWKPDKSPVRFVRRKREVFYVAGLWRAVERQELDVPVTELSFVLLTTAAVPSVAPIHNRMPFIVHDDQLVRWLNNSELRTPNSELLSEAPLDWYPVSREVNNVRNESPDLIRPAPLERELF
jgi:putative SOS response-associated peptidase YedK